MKEINPHYKKRLNQGQLQNILKHNKRKLAKYNSLQNKALKQKLKPVMITLSPKVNAIDATIELRKKFFKLVNDSKIDNFLYFSAIELGFKDEQSDEYRYSTLENQEKMDTPNFHIHIQTWSNLTKEQIDELLESIDDNVSEYKKASFAKDNDMKFTYVVKNLIVPNYKEISYLKEHCKGKTIYTSSQNQSNVATKIYNYFQNFLKGMFKNMKDKKNYIDRLKKSNNIVISKGKSKNYNSRYYEEIVIPNSSYIVYIRRVIKAIRNTVYSKSVPYTIKRLNHKKNSSNLSIFSKAVEMKNRILNKIKIKFFNQAKF